MKFCEVFFTLSMCLPLSAAQRSCLRFLQPMLSIQFIYTAKMSGNARAWELRDNLENLRQAHTYDVQQHACMHGSHNLSFSFPGRSQSSGIDGASLTSCLRAPISFVAHV